MYYVLQASDGDLKILCFSRNLVVAGLNCNNKLKNPNSHIANYGFVVFHKECKTF